MKKLIAISVMLALFTGAAFAQVSVSGSVGTRVYLLDVTFDDDDSTKAGAQGGIADAFIQLSGQNNEGTLGGLFRFRNTDGVDGGDPRFHRVFTWWKPIPQVRVFLGIDNDGMFDTAQFVGWGFHQGSNDYHFNHHWDFWRGIFPGNWDGFGMAISLYPSNLFSFNVVVPFGGLGWFQGKVSTVTERKDWEKLVTDLRFQGNVNIEDIGVVQFAINLGDKDAGGATNAFEEGGHMGRYGVSFLLTALDGMQAIVGGSIVPYDYDDDNIQINIGAGFAYLSEVFGVKARVGANFRGEAEKFLNFNVMPYFNLGPGSLMVDFGLSVDLRDSVEDNVGWFATPTYRLPISGGSLHVGLQLYNNINMGGNIKLSGNTDTKFRIPLSLSFGF